MGTGEGAIGAAALGGGMTGSGIANFGLKLVSAANVGLSLAFRGVGTSKVGVLSVITGNSL